MNSISFDIKTLLPILKKHLGNNVSTSLIIHPVNDTLIAIQTNKPYISTTFIITKHDLKEDIAFELKKVILLLEESSGSIEFTSVTGGVLIKSDLFNIVADKAYESYTDMSEVGCFNTSLTRPVLNGIISKSNSMSDVSKATKTSISKVYLDTDGKAYLVYPSVVAEFTTNLKLEIPLIITNAAIKLFMSHVNQDEGINLHYDENVAVFSTNSHQTFAYNSSVYKGILRDVKELTTFNEEYIFTTNLFNKVNIIETLSKYNGAEPLTITFYSTGEFELIASSNYSYKSNVNISDTDKCFSFNVNASILNSITKFFKSSGQVYVSKRKEDVLCFRTENLKVLISGIIF